MLRLFLFFFCAGLLESLDSLCSLERPSIRKLRIKKVHSDSLNGLTSWEPAHLG